MLSSVLELLPNLKSTYFASMNPPIIVAHDVTGKHLFRTQNISEQHQKHFLCPGHKICVRNKRCVRGQTGKHLCRQQCVRNNVSSFARALRTISKPCDVIHQMWISQGGKCKEKNLPSTFVVFVTSRTFSRSQEF